jgi:hypothetical protein
VAANLSPFHSTENASFNVENAALALLVIKAKRLLGKSGKKE